MKKYYTKPEARFVDINLDEDVLDLPIANSDELSNKGVWEESDGSLPVAKSVWGDEEEEEK